MQIFLFQLLSLYGPRRIRVFPTLRKGLRNLRWSDNRALFYSLQAVRRPRFTPDYKQRADVLPRDLGTTSTLPLLRSQEQVQLHCVQCRSLPGSILCCTLRSRTLLDSKHT